MLSEEAQLYIKQQKESFVPYPDWEHMDYVKIRQDYEKEMTSLPVADGTSFEKSKEDGIPVEWVRVANAEKLILYIHGGGMVIGSSACSRYMVSHIAKMSGRSAVGVDYRLCPEVSYPVPLEDCVRVYKCLLKKGYRSENIAFLGESAGGCLVLSLLAYCHYNQLPMPGGACVISPSADFTFASHSYESNAKRELIVNLNLREQLQAFFLKDANVKDPVLSPIFSDVTDWPPVYFQVASEEILFDDSLRMYLKLQEAGRITRLSVAEDLIHTYQMMPMPESREAFQKIAEFFKNLE